VTQDETKTPAANPVPNPAQGVYLATPTIGRIVHVVLPTGASMGCHRAAIVTNTWRESQGKHPPGATPEAMAINEMRASLTVFLDPADRMAINPVYCVTNMEYDGEGQRPGTWHWPEME